MEEGFVAVNSTISNGFKTAGVWPANRNVLPEHLFEIANNMDVDSYKTQSNQSTSVLQDTINLINKIMIRKNFFKPIQK